MKRLLDGRLESRRRRAGALAGAVVVAVLTACPAVAVAARTPRVSRTPTAAVPAGPDRVELLGQSTWVRAGGTFDLHLAVSAGDPRTDVLQVAAYPELTTRSAFDAAVGGVESGPPEWSVKVPLASAPAGRGGGVELRIPVDAASRGSELEELSTAGDHSGVYPVELQLFSAADSPLGRTLSTFVVFDGDDLGADKLAVSLTVPVGAAPSVARGGTATALPASTVRRLSSLVSVLDANPTVPVSLAVTPQTAVALAEGNRGARAVDAGITALVAGGDQLLPAPYVATSLDGLETSGLGGQVAAQVQAGTAALRDALGSTPSPATWVVDGPLDHAALRALRAQGLQRLVVPDRDLSAVPAQDQSTTYGNPTALAGSTRRGPDAMGADATLSTRVGRKEGAVLAAEQDLAELAMIQLEYPSVARGVAIVVPAHAPSAWLRILVGGLAGNPFATAVTVDRLFSQLTPQPSAAAESPPRLVATSKAGVRGAGRLRSLGGKLQVLDRIVPSETAVLADLRRRMLVAESDQLTPATRTAVIDGAEAVIDGIRDKITLPASASVTLTARSATVPITIESNGHLVVHVEVVLASSKLVFRPLQPPDGRCRVDPTLLDETCQLVMRDAATETLRVPVESRTSGVFPLTVTVLSPGGGSVLGTERDTIRSTTVSFVGLVLIIGAALFLGVWWIHNIRHGRRAHRLVPPEDGPEDGQGGSGPDDVSPVPPRPDRDPDRLPDEWFDGDPVVARFFSAPAPLRQPEMSPSDGRPGPNP